MLRLGGSVSRLDRTLWLRRTFVLVAVCTVGVGVGSVAVEWIAGETLHALPPAVISIASLVLSGRLLLRTSRYGRTEADARLLFHEVVDHLPSGFTMKDPNDLTYIAWNHATELMTGIPRERALGRTARELFGTDLGARVEAWDREALAAPDVVVREDTIEVNHRTRSLLSRRMVVRDARDRPAYLFVLDDDVTPLRRRELEVLQRHRLVLRHQQALLELGERVPATLADAVRGILLQAVRTLDVRRGGFWWLSDDASHLRCAYLVVEGKVVEPAELVLRADAYLGFFAALREHRPIVAADARTHTATSGFTETYLGPLDIGALLAVPVWHGGRVVGVVSVEHVGGTRAWPQEQIDFGVALAGLVSLAIETDRRRRAETALREQRRAEEIASFLNAMPLGVFVMDRNGHPAFANAHAVELLGRAVRPDVSTPGLAHVYEAFRVGTGERYPAERMPVVRALDGETCIADDMEVHQPDGKVVPLEVHGAPVFDAAGNVAYAVAVFRDITERRHIERVKDELISVVSHELRTPMTAVIGALGLVEGGVLGPVPPQVDEMVRVALNSARRLVRLLNDMLVLDKLVQAKEALRTEPRSMLRLVAEAVELARPSAEAEGVRIDIRSGVDATVHVDGERILQVLQNLLSNATKYSPREGRITLDVAVQPDGAVRVSVSDEGPGIPSEMRGKLFQRFGTIDSSTTRAKGGTGLGLSICKAIVEIHGGRVGVDSVLGRGSTFWFELPLRPAEGGASS